MHTGVYSAGLIFTLKLHEHIQMTHRQRQNAQSMHVQSQRKQHGTGRALCAAEQLSGVDHSGGCCLGNQPVRKVMATGQLCTIYHTHKANS